MSEPSKTSQTNESYEVFGRDNVERPLQHLGTVQAPNKLLAVAHAKFVYSERPWVELCLSPTTTFSGCLKAGQDGQVGMA